MNVIFRVDSSLNIGTGHVMRCLTLAQVLKDNGANVEFVCRRHSGNQIKKIRSKGFFVYILEIFSDFEVDTKLHHSRWLGVKQKQDASDCVKIIGSKKVDWLIVDHYSLDEDWQRELKPYVKKLMVIDDLADRKHQCDMLIDQTFGRVNSDYCELVPSECVLILGPYYALLRPEFSIWREYSLERRSSFGFKRLLVNMGGVDVNNITGQVLQELLVCDLPKELIITVVMGESAPHLESVRLNMDCLPFHTIVKVEVDNMAELLSNTDIAIGAAGATTWERCCLGLGAIQLVIAENQIFSAEMLDRYNIVKLAKSVKNISDLLINHTEWVGRMSEESSRICDGMGANRVFNRMTGGDFHIKKIGKVSLLNYVGLSKEDLFLALEMRNHNEVKKWMYNTNNISKEAHFKFIKILEHDLNRRYFIVKCEGHIIGSINFSSIYMPQSIEFGIYANPFSSLKNKGLILEEAASYYAFVELEAHSLELRVLPVNKRAIDFYTRCGFIFDGIVEEKGFDMIRMKKNNKMVGRE